MSFDTQSNQLRHYWKPDNKNVTLFTIKMLKQGMFDVSRKLTCISIYPSLFDNFICHLLLVMSPLCQWCLRCESPIYNIHIPVIICYFVVFTCVTKGKPFILWLWLLWVIISYDKLILLEGCDISWIHCWQSRTREKLHAYKSGYNYTMYIYKFCLI